MRYLTNHRISLVTYLVQIIQKGFKNEKTKIEITQYLRHPVIYSDCGCIIAERIPADVDHRNDFDTWVDIDGDIDLFTVKSA